MPIVNDPEERLDELIDKADPLLRKEVAFLLARLQSAFSESELADMVSTSNFDDLHAEVNRVAAAMASSITTLAYMAGGISTAEWMTENLGVLFSFDQANFRAAAFISENQVALARDFVVSQQEMVSDIISRGTRAGINPIEQARQIKTGLGLTRFQETAVENFRQQLIAGDSAALSRGLRDKRFDGTVRHAVAGDITLSISQVDRMVERYRERYIKYRSEVIARTEALGGIHAGAEGMYQQAIDSGDLDADSLVKEWHTAGDERVRGTHRPMNRQKRLEGEAFTSGAGVSLMYPGDQRAPVDETIQCRCAMSRRIVL